MDEGSRIVPRSSSINPQCAAARRASSSGSLRILLITGGSPWPTQLGVNQRTHLLWRAVRQCGAVDTVIVSRYVEVSDEEREHLRDAYGVVACFRQRGPGDRWPWQLAGRVAPSLAERLGVHVGGMGAWYRPQADVAGWLARRLEGCHYDLIVGRYLRSLASSGALDYRPVVLDLDDFDCSTQKSRLQQPGLSILQRCSARRQIRQVEKAVAGPLGRCEHIWVASREDQELLNSYPTSVLPNIPFELDGTTPVAPCVPRPESKSMLIVGSLRHTVNVRAVDRFLRTAWPHILRSEPRGELRIVGYGMTEMQKDRWGAVPGVVPVGFVEDLRAEYDRCAFTVVPVFEGGGTKIKVLESLRYGRTVVATAHSCRGYADTLRHGEALWEAAGESALVDGCIRLLREPGLREKMADAGCRLVRRDYSQARFQQVVREAVERVAVAGRRVQVRRTVS